MLDVTTHPVVDTPPQDVGQANIVAPMPCGCRRWFVLATKPHAERRAHTALHLKGYQPYLPTIDIRRHDRSWRTVPLFAGYCFVHLDPGKPWYPIKWCPGALHLIAVDGIPQPCRQGSVEALQAAEAARRCHPAEKDTWAPGAAVALAGGMWDGIPGIILKTGKDMALVSMLMFGQLREIAVSFDCLRPRDG